MKADREVINQAVLEFSGVSCNEAFARGAAAAFAAAMDPTLEEISDIKTAVSEAVSNSIIHAYPGSLGKIYMTMTIYSGRLLEIMVRDCGIGIPNITKAMEPMFSTGGEGRSGMGFTIMQRFMTELEVDSAPGSGTTVTMRRQLSSGDAGL